MSRFLVRLGALLGLPGCSSCRGTFKRLHNGIKHHHWFNNNLMGLTNRNGQSAKNALVSSIEPCIAWRGSSFACGEVFHNFFPCHMQSPVWMQAVPNRFCGVDIISVRGVAQCNIGFRGRHVPGSTMWWLCGYRRIHKQTPLQGFQYGLCVQGMWCA